MQKKKLLTIVALLVLVLVLSLISSRLISGKGKSNKALDDFVVADTAAVDRLVLSQSTGYSLELVRKNGSFVTITGDCIQEEMIDNILHTFTKVAVRSFVPQNSVENLRNNIRVNYKKVQIFQNGKWVKTWWIGSSTPDHYGTYAILETPDDGISDVPVILEMRGLRGSIESRFTADPRAWVCTSVFAYAINDIQEIKVKHHENVDQDFKITRVGQGRAFKLTDFRNNSVIYDTLKLVRYLDLFKKAHFESVNYTMTQEQVDSMKRAKPWLSIALELTNGKKITLDAYRIKAPEGDTDLTGAPIEWDANRLWAILDKKQLVKIQYFVFDPFFVDITYFQPKRTFAIP
jgi:hypothetical protein